MSYRRHSDEGKFLIKRKFRRDRMQVKVQAIKQELRQRMHQLIPDQGKWLKRIVQGYFNTDAKEKARINKEAAQKGSPVRLEPLG